MPVENQFISCLSSLTREKLSFPYLLRQVFPITFSCVVAPSPHWRKHQNSDYLTLCQIELKFFYGQGLSNAIEEIQKVPQSFLNCGYHKPVSLIDVYLICVALSVGCFVMFSLQRLFRRRLSNSRLMLVTCVNRCFEKSIECAIGSESKAKQIAQT